jgi:hypothetical protein
VFLVDGVHPRVKLLKARIAFPSTMTEVTRRPETPHAREAAAFIGHELALSNPPGRAAQEVTLVRIHPNPRRFK